MTCPQSPASTRGKRRAQFCVSPLPILCLLALFLPKLQQPRSGAYVPVQCLGPDSLTLSPASQREHRPRRLQDSLRGLGSASAFPGLSLPIYEVWGVVLPTELAAR